MQLSNMYLIRLAGTIPSFLGSFKNLTVLRLNDNSLHGTIPMQLSKCVKLNTLRLYNNFLEGPIPYQFSTSLLNLQELQLQNNAFTGELFLSGQQHMLETVDVSNNLFQGNIPLDVFAVNASLKNFAAVRNCFEGKLSWHICRSKRLETLAMDGLAAAEKCPQSWLGKLSPRLMSGSIPDCNNRFY